MKKQHPSPNACETFNSTEHQESKIQTPQKPLRVSMCVQPKTDQIGVWRSLNLLDTYITLGNLFGRSAFGDIVPFVHWGSSLEWAEQNKEALHVAFANSLGAHPSEIRGLAFLIVLQIGCNVASRFQAGGPCWLRCWCASTWGCWTPIASTTGLWCSHHMVAGSALAKSGWGFGVAPLQCQHWIHWILWPQGNSSAASAIDWWLQCLSSGLVKALHWGC